MFSRCLCNLLEQIVQPSIFIFTFQCFVFHLYKGVRAGGGIGDEIGEPDGDDYEVYRIMFDITFFFFVIVILLAIIQGKSKKILMSLIVCSFLALGR